MVSQAFIQGMVDWLVNFTTDLLIPIMATGFLLAVTMRSLIFVTVSRENWFISEFSRRVRKFIDNRDSQKELSFYVTLKRLLEITYYEVFEIRSIMKRRNPDAIMSLADRVFLVQPGSARLVTDLLRQSQFLRFNERPKFTEISNSVLRNNNCFSKVFGIIPVSGINDFLNTVPGLFIVGGIFGTFLGIMKALPELGGMNLSDVEGAKLVMDNFLLKISFSMTTSIVGIFFSVFMGVLNTFLSSEKAYVEAVEKLTFELDTIWNMANHNKLPQQIPSFEADRDPIEVLSEGLIAKEIGVDSGFVSLIRPISRWWKKPKMDHEKIQDIKSSDSPLSPSENNKDQDHEDENNKAA